MWSQRTAKTVGKRGAGNMADRQLGVVEDTLYVPMLGRIYASENHRSILYDRKALGLKAHLPREVVENDSQTQYTYLASAVRSANMDRFIANFLADRPDGVIVQLGCGLETTYYRDDGHAPWYGVDLPHVIDYRRTILPETGREHYIAGGAFEEDWLERVRREHSGAPLLVTASGLFYYFEEEQVLGLIRMLQGKGDIQLLFDAVSKSGMFMMRKKYMKTVGHEDARMFFYVDSARELASKVGGNVTVLAEENFYCHVSKVGLRLSTKLSMRVSDLLGMVKMVHLGLS